MAKADDSPTEPKSLALQLCDLRDELRLKGKARLREVRDNEKDADFRKLAYQATAADFLHRLYDKANYNRDGKRTPPIDGTGLRAISDAAIKVRASIQTGKPPKWSRLERECFDEAIGCHDNLAPSMTFLHVAKSDSDTMTRRRAIHLATGTAAAFAAGAAALGGAFLKRQEVESTPERTAIAVSGSDKERLRASLDEQRQLLDNREAWVPANIKGTLARLEAAQTSGKRVLDHMQDATSPLTKTLLGASGITALGGAISAILAIAKASQSHRENDDQNLKEIKPHLQAIVNAVAELMENNLQVVTSASKAR